MNGAFLSDPPQGLAHPLQGWTKALTAGADHTGFNATLLPLDDLQTTLLVWRSGKTHAAREGSELKMAVSHDEGSSFGGLRSIYLSPEWDTRNFAGGLLGKGRVGLIASRFLGAGVDVEMAPPVFIFSDDGGVSWQVRETDLPSTTPFTSFHGDIVRWPAKAGGDDELGFAAFSYNVPRKTIDGIYTRDNGETWEWKTDICRSDETFASHVTECWVAAVLPEGPWIMVARPTTTGNAANLAVFTSDDLVDWKGPIDGGLLLSGNAPALIVENGRAFLYTVARRGGRRELPNVAKETLGNRLLMASVAVDDLLAGRAGFGDRGGWHEVAALPGEAVGYIFPRKIRRRWFAVFNCGETGSVGTSESKRNWLGLITPHPPFVVDAGLMQAAVPAENLADNGDFSIWARGTRFENVAAGRLTADRWAVSHGDKDNVCVEKVREAHPLGGPSTWMRKSCGAPTGTSAHRTIQSHADVAMGADGRVTLMMRARCNLGGTSSLAAIKLVQDFGRGGSAPVEIVLAKNFRVSNAPLLYTFSGALPALTGKTIGAGAALRLVIEERAEKDTSPYDVTYGDIAFVPEPTAVAVRPRSLAANEEACRRYFRRSVLCGQAVGGGAVGAALLHDRFAAMARAPNVRLAAGEEPEGRIWQPVSGKELALVSLCDGRVQFLAGPHATGTLVGAELEFDAEWAIEELGSRQWTIEEPDSGTLRSFDPDIWTTKDYLLSMGLEVAAGLKASNAAKAIQDKVMEQARKGSA